MTEKRAALAADCLYVTRNKLCISRLPSKNLHQSLLFQPWRRVRLGKAVVELVFLEQNKEKLLCLLTQHLLYTCNQKRKNIDLWD